MADALRKLRKCPIESKPENQFNNQNREKIHMEEL